MRTIYVLLLVAFAILAESYSGLRRRSKRELVRSKRRWVLSTFELQEEDPGPFPRELSRMFNDKLGQEDNHEFSISGAGVDVEPLNVFSIHPSTGVVTVHKSIDREKYKEPFHIKFDIFDKFTKQRLDKELSFDVEIKDINDNPPTFTNPHMTVNVMENTPEGYLPVQLYVTDEDQANNPNSKVSITMISQDPQEPKIQVEQFDDHKSQLTFSGCFDYDKIKKYEVIVQAKDHGKPSLSSTAVVTLNIIDANTHPPKFKEKKYQGEVYESTIQENVLRIAVEDQDTPKTPGWRAKYYFIKGNEDGSFKIETDPKTNEGILSVIKGRDYEKTTLTSLQIGVENEEPLWVCKEKSTGRADADSQDSANITMKVIDVNDPPEFTQSTVNVYHNEEEKPGKVLFTAEVHDVDSNVSQIRYVLFEDPANWVSIDEKTGAITSTQPMDRESTFLNGTDFYKVLIGAIDNDVPPATGTCTVLVHLRDINDNKPQLVNKNAIMCGNKVNKIMVPAKDADSGLFSGPFSFSLGGEDKTLQERWKLEPFYGEECGLISLKTLAYGNYSVPLVIQDQQNLIGHDILEVRVCDCGNSNVCPGRVPLSSSLGAAGIGLIFAGLLLFLLLLCLFLCECGKKLNHRPMLEEEGKSTLIKYNLEGGVSECKPTLVLTPTSTVVDTGSMKQGSMQTYQMAPLMTDNKDMYNSSSLSLMNSNMSSLGMQHQDRGHGWQAMQQREFLRSHGGQIVNTTWTRNRTNPYQGGSSRFDRSFSLWSNQNLADHIDRRLCTMDGAHVEHPQYQPHQYIYEGEDSKCQSLDGLSLSNLGDDLTFLNDLGPNFNTLGAIFQKTRQENKMQL